MSHYSVAVITKTDKIDELQKLLAPFDESLEVEPYIYKTKEELIWCAKYIKSRLASYYNKYENKFIAAETDEDFYNCMHLDNFEYDKEGNQLSTYNPNSKWDEYHIGGRYSYLLKRINSSAKYNQLQLKYIDFTDFFTHAVLTPDGQWFELNDVVDNLKSGNLYISKEEVIKWKKIYKHNYDNINPDYYVTIVDCHI